jgi:hypothetical protein
MTDADHQDLPEETDEHYQRPPVPLVTVADLHYPYGKVEAAAQAHPPAASQKPAASRTYIYAVIGAGLGLLVGGAIAAHVFRFDMGSGRYDLGSVVSSRDGLKGHLFTEWNGRLEYRLRIEPGDPAQLAGFALAVTNSPHPISFDIQLKDPGDFILCGAGIVLKFDPQKALVGPATDAEPRAARAGTGNAPWNQAAQGIEVARSEAEEIDREHGKNLFQNETGQDGRIGAITSQGQLPCSQGAYEKAVSWSFSSNFPSLAEQDQLRDPLPEQKPEKAAGSSSRRSAPGKNGRLTQAENLLSFSVEGDDAIVEFDLSRGVIETSAGRSFFIDRKSAGDIAAAWQDYPVRVHYMCDRNAVCTLMHAGERVLHARMGR